MTYQTLYRKYRPKSFELVYGQDTIVKTLKNIIKNGKIGHAYLFTGPRGTGKTSCAKLFAKTINCVNNKDGDACNQCESCNSYNQNSNPDIIEIDAASNNGVDEIREIKNKANLVPTISKYKVYIIDEVHMLSIGAFNALLKTLEEPPKYIIFILATTEPQKLPSTIISRCQRFDFKNISFEKSKECLLNICNQEKIEIDDEALNEIVFNSKGGLRDAIGMLDQSYIYCNGKINKKSVQELFGTVSDVEIMDFVRYLNELNYKNTINKIREWDKNGKDIILILQKLIEFIKKGLLYKKNIEEKINADEKHFFDNCTDTILFTIIDSFSEILNKIQLNYQKSLIFEIQIIKLLDILEKNNQKKLKNGMIDKVKNYNESNVSRETLDKKEENKLENLILELKKIRINNILKDSVRKELKDLENVWNNISEFLIEEEYKLIAGILIEGKPVAASQKGLIIALNNDSNLNRIENNYDSSKKLINKICDKEYKIVYVTAEYWNEIRPYYVEKVKNGMLDYIDEKKIIEKIKKIKRKDSINEFSDLIEIGI